MAGPGSPGESWRPVLLLSLLLSIFFGADRMFDLLRGFLLQAYSIKSLMNRVLADPARESRLLQIASGKGTDGQNDIRLRRLQTMAIQH